jgi:hypothetical protein
MEGLQVTGPRPIFERDNPAADLSQQRIKRRAILGGLIYEYQRTAYKPRSRPMAEFWNPAS